MGRDIVRVTSTFRASVPWNVLTYPLNCTYATVAHLQLDGPLYNDL